MKFASLNIDDVFKADDMEKAVT